MYNYFEVVSLVNFQTIFFLNFLCEYTELKIIVAV